MALRREDNEGIHIVVFISPELLAKAGSKREVIAYAQQEFTEAVEEALDDST